MSNLFALLFPNFRCFLKNVSIRAFLNSWNYLTVTREISFPNVKTINIPILIAQLVSQQFLTFMERN